MQSKEEMQQGWEFASSIMGSDIAAHMGHEYVNRVGAAIKQLEDSINNHTYRNLPPDKFQGYVFEEYEAGTFNANATAAGSKAHVNVLHLNTKDSVDHELKFGSRTIKTYSAKSYATAEKTAKAQARLNPDTRRASYQGQGRLVPSDHLDEAKAVTHRQALKNQNTRPEVAEANAETERELTSTIKYKRISSKEVKRKTLDRMARKGSKQRFKAAEYGVTVEEAIKPEYIAKQAIKAGYTAAAITVAVQLAPEIFKAIDYLIKHGEIDAQQIRTMGVKGISSGAEGFLRGSISSSLLIMCENGVLGEAFRGINPTVLGTVVALVMQTVKNSILVAAGKMTSQQMGAAFVDTVVISGGYLAGAYIGGVIGQAIGFELPVVGYLLGSLIGTAFSVVYNIGKKKLISFCVDTGFTCFGLVEQDYQLPEEILKEMGIDTIPISRAEVSHTEIGRVQIGNSLQRVNYETIDFKFVKRGIIGVNKIGYVYA